MEVKSNAALFIVSAKTIYFFLERDIISSNSPDSGVARALNSLHAQHELKDVRVHGRWPLPAEGQNMQRGRRELVLARIYAGIEWDSICQLLALYQYSQKPTDFLLLCAVSS